MKRLLILVLLAGCGAPAGPDVPDIDWGTLEVETTPAEPWEPRGPVRVAWEGDLFGLWASIEPDVAGMTVHGDGFYRTVHGMGWTRVEASALSNRVTLWDLRLLVEEGDVRSRSEGGLTVLDVTGTVRHGQQDVAYSLTLRLQGDAIVSADLESPQGREGPFRFTPTTEPLAFPLAVPEDALSRDEAQAGTTRARNQHALLIGLIDDRATTPGRGLPDEVDPQSMQVEMLRRNVQWPMNAFDGTPLADQEESGHFSWTRCGAQHGAYVGYGWDGAILSQTWGDGCGARDA